MMNNYMEILLDTNFLNEYKYVTKEQFIFFVKMHIDKLLRQIEISNFNAIEHNNTNNLEQKIYDILDSSIKLYSCVLEDELNEEDLDKVIYELVKRKVFNDVIDNIIVLEEIEYLQIYNITEKLKFIYYYLLELEIYNYYSIERIKWKNEKQKQYVSNKVKYSSLLQNKIKQDFIDNGSLSKKDMYLYNKTIGIISTYPIKEIINKYNDRILTDVYRIKYLLTLESKLQKCSDNKVLEKKNETIVIEHKSFFKELLDKYKKLIEKKDSSIRKLEKENNVLKKENV